MGTRILLADGCKIFVAGLRALLEGEAGLSVVAEARDGEEAVRLATEMQPDVVVLEVALAGLAGIEAARTICARSPQTRVLCLAASAEKQLVVAALEAGASGFVLRDCEPDELVRALRAVAGGHSHLSTEASDALVADYRTTNGRPAATPPLLLTAREREVLAHLAEGLSAKAIAARFGLSVKTVTCHREHLMAKLGLRSIAELTKYAIRHGLTSVGH
ncbi:MAG TPA: response regulator transcription factor [Thermoanaerobaculia bacterium]|nr:response regulator transcription factor [Thermoanaerobaculia bacterium]